MLSLPILLVLAGVTVWGVFQPSLAGWSFAALVSLFAVWQLGASWSLRPKALEPDQPPYYFSAEEIAVFRRHALYFRHPLLARQYSGMFSSIQLMCWVWFPILLWHEQWLLAGTFVVLFLGASNMAPYLNPGQFLRHHQSRGSLTEALEQKLQVVESVESKLSGPSAV